MLAMVPAAAAVLLFMGLCAFALDAFVVVPVEIPPLRALAPFLAAQLVVLSAVLAFPALTHGLGAPEQVNLPQPGVSPEELERRYREMLQPPPEEEQD